MGPVSEFRLKELAQSGEIVPTTLIWQKGMEKWVPVGELKPELFESPSEAEIPAPPPLVVKSKPDASYLLRRLMAKMFDFALVTLVLMWFVSPLVQELNPPEDPQALKEKLETDSEFAALLAAFYLKTFLYSMMAHLSYQTICLTLWSATLGKLMLGLRVIHVSGVRLTPLQALARAAGDLLNLIICSGLSYAAILFDRQRLGIHDRLCRTRVIEKDSFEQN